MEKFLRIAVAALALLFPEIAAAQNVTPLPLVATAQTALDLGSGPMEIRIVQGNALFNTGQGTAIGSTSGSSTTLTLTTVPAVNPCTGCGITGAGITAGTTVSSISGATITLSAAMTVAASTPVTFATVCPITPVGVVMPLQANQTGGGDLPFYTTAHICAYATNAVGAALLAFPIGAH